MWGRKQTEEPSSVPIEPERPPPRSEEVSDVPTYKPDPFKFSPLRFDELCRESRNVNGTAELFDGFRFEFQRMLTPYFAITHSLAMGSVIEPSSYNFISNLLLGKATFVGRVDTDGNVQGRITHVVGDRFSYTVAPQTSPQPHNSGIQVDAELRGATWNATGRWANPGTFGLSYTQRVHPRVTLGLDVFYVSRQGISAMNTGLRYEGKNTINTVILNGAQFVASSSHKLAEKVYMSTELATAWHTGALETSWSFGADYVLRASHLKARVDSKWKVSCYLEEMLNQHTRFMLSAELDHNKKNYKFGFGVGMAI